MALKIVPSQCNNCNNQQLSYIKKGYPVVEVEPLVVPEVVVVVAIKQQLVLHKTRKVNKKSHNRTVATSDTLRALCIQ